MYIKRIPLGPVSANCYVICDEKSGEGAVVDPGEYNSVLEKEIKEANIKSLKYILCTHGHFDHINGVKKLKEHYPTAVIAIGEGDAPLLSDSEKSLADVFGAYQDFSKADLLLHENDVLSLGKTEFRVMETPGHSLGGVCYICDSERFLLSGDTLFRLTVGRCDMWGSDRATLEKSLDRLGELPEDYTVFTGHNISTTVGAEKTDNRYFRRRK